MASRLEASTKQYGVPLLLSGAIFDILSPKVKNYCRHIDTIMIKGNQNPLLIYTSDVDTDNCVPGDGLDKSKEQTNKLRKSLKAKLDRGQIDSCDLFKDSREIALLREGITEEFLRTFDEAMNFYQSGDWDSAKMQFEVALKLRPNDGPSKTLLL